MKYFKNNQNSFIYFSMIVFFLPVFLLGLIPELQYIVLAAGMLIIMTMPFLNQEIDWFSPWTTMFFGVILSVFLRSIAITFDIPDNENISELFLLGKNKDFIFMSMILSVAAIFVMTLGYITGLKKKQIHIIK